MKAISTAKAMPLPNPPLLTFWIERGVAIRTMSRLESGKCQFAVEVHLVARRLVAAHLQPFHVVPQLGEVHLLGAFGDHAQVGRAVHDVEDLSVGGLRLRSRNRSMMYFRLFFRRQAPFSQSRLSAVIRSRTE